MQTSISLYIDVVFFFFSFISKTSAREASMRERAVNKTLRFIFYHARSTDFEEKMEGLWTG